MTLRRVLAALLLPTAASAATLVPAPASAQYFEYRRKPILQRYNTRAIIGNEVYSPARNSVRDDTATRNGPGAHAERPDGPGDAITPKPQIKPTAAQCVAGCG